MAASWIGRSPLWLGFHKSAFFDFKAPMTSRSPRDAAQWAGLKVHHTYRYMYARWSKATMIAPRLTNDVHIMQGRSPSLWTFCDKILTGHWTEQTYSKVTLWLENMVDRKQKLIRWESIFTSFSVHIMTKYKMCRNETILVNVYDIFYFA